MNDTVAILDTVVIGYGLAAGLLDLVDDDIRGLLRFSTVKGHRKHVTDLCSLAFTLEGATKIVDDDAGTSRAKECCIRFSESTASASDHNDLTVKSQLGHDEVFNVTACGFERGLMSVTRCPIVGYFGCDGQSDVVGKEVGCEEKKALHVL